METECCDVVAIAQGGRRAEPLPLQDYSLVSRETGAALEGKLARTTANILTGRTEHVHSQGRHGVRASQPSAHALGGPCRRRSVRLPTAANGCQQLPLGVCSVCRVQGYFARVESTLNLEGTGLSDGGRVRVCGSSRCGFSSWPCAEPSSPSQQTRPQRRSRH